jgi:hypothetical protein
MAWFYVVIALLGLLGVTAHAQSPSPPPAVTQSQPAQPPTSDQVARELCNMARARAEADAAAVIAQNLKTLQDRDHEIATLKAELAKLKTPAEPAKK